MEAVVEVATNGGITLLGPRVPHRMPASRTYRSVEPLQSLPDYARGLFTVVAERGFFLHNGVQPASLE